MADTNPNEEQWSDIEKQGWAMALENLKALFRQQMAQGIRPGESLLEARARITKDPATLQVARRLGTSVAELMEGFGQPQTFFVEGDYDHLTEWEAVQAALTRVIEIPIGLNDEVIDDQVAVMVRHVGAKVAPPVGARRRQVLGDTSVATQVRRQLLTQRPRPRPVIARSRRGRRAS